MVPDDVEIVALDPVTVWILISCACAFVSSVTLPLADKLADVPNRRLLVLICNCPPLVNERDALSSMSRLPLMALNTVVPGVALVSAKLPLPLMVRAPLLVTITLLPVLVPVMVPRLSSVEAFAFIVKTLFVETLTCG